MAAALPYNDAIGDIICERLATGETLKAICGGGDVPCRVTVYGWLRDNEDFANKYARARKDWAETQLEEIIEIADDLQLKPDDKRVRIDTRKWAMGKLNGKYSDKVKHVGGDEGDAPIRTVTGIEWSVVTPPA